MSTGEIRKCIICGNERYFQPYELKRGGGRFCSDVCCHKSKRTGETRECLTCKKAVYCDKSKLKYQRSYCSNECYRSGNTLECLICGKKKFVGTSKAQYSANEFYCASCRKSEKVITIKCLNCGIEKDYYRSQIELGKKFCSLVCLKQWRISNKKGGLRKCLVCAKEYYRIPSWRNAKYCSRQCYNGRPLKIKKLTRCAVCEQTISRSMNRVEKIKGEKIYCSLECVAAGRTNYNGIYSPDFLYMLMMSKSEYCAFPDCPNPRIRDGLKLSTWHCCKFHTERIYYALRGREQRRKAFIFAHQTSEESIEGNLTLDKDSLEALVREH